MLQTNILEALLSFLQRQYAFASETESLLLTVCLAKVARALTLWLTGAVTLEMVKDSKRTKVINEELGRSIKINRTIVLPKFVDLEDGSRLSTAFNDVSWGKSSRKYMRWVQSMRVTSVEKVIEKAVALVPTSRGGASTSAVAVDDSEGVVMVIDISHSDDECELR